MRKISYWLGVGVLSFALVVAIAPVSDVIAAISFGSVETGTNSSNPGSSSSIEISRPSLTTEGDFLIAGIVINGGNDGRGTQSDNDITITSVPDGWTLIERTDNDGDIAFLTYYKFTGGSEPLSYTWEFERDDSNDARAAGGILRYTGVHLTDPIDESAENEGFGFNPIAPSVSTDFANDRVIVFYAQDDDRGHPQPLGTTERYDVENSNSNGPRTSAADFIAVSAGGTGTKSIFLSGNENWIAQTIALREAEEDPAILTVTKTVVNNNGGTAEAEDFDLFVDEEEVVSGEPEEFEAGTYNVSEDGPDGYAATFSGDCNPDGSIEMEAGESYECTIVNNDQPALLTIIKYTEGGDGEFGFDVTGETYDEEEYEDSFGIETEGGEGTEVLELDAGTYTVTEDDLPSGWDAEGDTECVVGLTIGEEAICEFTNIKRASLTVVKIADPQGGEFQFDLDGPSGQEDIPATHTFSPDGEWTLEDLLPGEYILEETIISPEDWTGSQEIACNGGGDNDPEGSVDSEFGFELNPGDAMSCVVNNTQDAVISGQKFEDMDGDGPGNTGEGLEGWTIEFYTQGEGWEFHDSTETDEFGNYTHLIQPGTYLVCEMGEEGWHQSYPTSETENYAPCGEIGRGYLLTVEAGSNTNGIDFGNYRTGTIAGAKWHDEDGDGMIGDGEPGLSGWTIELRRDSSTIATEDTTGGTYQFVDVVPGEYTLREVMQEGWAQSFPADNGEHEVTLISGGSVIDKNFGNLQDATISGLKWHDENVNGVFDENEYGLSGWGVYVDLNDNGEHDSGEPIVVTGEDGEYEIDGLLPGTYVIREVEQHGWGQVFPASGFHSVVLDINEDVFDINFGNAESITLTGAKWHDYNANGDWYKYGRIADPEPGIEGWTIFANPIINEGGDEDTGGDRSEKETETGEDGEYSFEFLPTETGWWRISEERQEGWTQTYPENPGYYDVFISPEGPGEQEELQEEEEEGPGYDYEEDIYTDYDFGNWENPLIQVLKWQDDDADSVRDEDDGDFTDEPIEQYPMTLGRVLNNNEGVIEVEIVALSLTGENGIAEMFAPLPGDYVVLEGQHDSWAKTYPASRTESLVTSFAPGLEPVPLIADSFFDIFVEWDMHGEVIDEGDFPGEEGFEEVLLEFGNHWSPDTSSDDSEGGRSSSGSVATPAAGEVLGASSSGSEGEVLGESICELPLTSYLRRGHTNDPGQVTELQGFLNGEMGLQPPLPLTGFFGPLTETAVKNFQLKYYEEVLKPWVDLGLLSPNTATGIVFKTTLWKIQTMMCPDYEVPKPILP